MKTTEVQIGQFIRYNKRLWTILAINVSKALIISPDGKGKWVGLNRIQVNKT